MKKLFLLIFLFFLFPTFGVAEDCVISSIPKNKNFIGISGKKIDINVTLNNCKGFDGSIAEPSTGLKDFNFDTRNFNQESGNGIIKVSGILEQYEKCSRDDTVVENCQFMLRFGGIERGKKRLIFRFKENSETGCSASASVTPNPIPAKKGQKVAVDLSFLDGCFEENEGIDKTFRIMLVGRESSNHIDLAGHIMPTSKKQKIEFTIDSFPKIVGASRGADYKVELIGPYTGSIYIKSSNPTQKIATFADATSDELENQFGAHVIRSTIKVKSSCPIDPKTKKVQPCYITSGSFIPFI